MSTLKVLADFCAINEIVKIKTFLQIFFTKNKEAFLKINVKQTVKL